MGDPNYGYPPVHDGGAKQKFAILFGAVIALLAANIFLYFQLEGTKEELAKVQDGLASEVATLRETSAANVQAQRRTVDTLRDQLDSARRAASMAAGQAKIDATKRAEELASKLEAAQEVQKRVVQDEFSAVKAAAAATDTRVTEVKTEVSKVDTKVDSTKSELDKTITDLKRVTGDLGITSGLVATNSSELAMLKALGERNYFDINLVKTKQPIKVGDILVKLKGTNEKRNRYTIEVTADDKLTEKKDKTVNEPVQFLVAGVRQPYEIVINEVGKDRIVGYLATPKVREPRK